MKAHLDVIIIVLTHKEVSYARAGLDTNWTEMARNAMVSYIFVSLRSSKLIILHIYLCDFLVSF